MEKLKNLSIDEASSLIFNILLKHQTSKSNAKHVTDALINAEIDGQKGHGLSRIPSYIEQLKSGKVNGMIEPIVVDRKGAVIKVDAANGFAFPAMKLAIEEIKQTIKQSKISAASIFNSHHFGQAGYHVESLANNGLVAIVFGNSPKAIAPWGGFKPIFGTNPIGFAAPRAKQAPLVIDLSLSQVARGKVLLAKQQKKPIPKGWAIDKKGKMTTNADEALEGSMLPIGSDAKGSALVLIVEILAAGLTGANFGFEASSFLDNKGKPPSVGQLIIAFDPEYFSNISFYEHLEVLISEIIKQPNVRLPGSKRFIGREKAKTEGLTIPENLYNQLVKLV